MVILNFSAKIHLLTERESCELPWYVGKSPVQPYAALSPSLLVMWFCRDYRTCLNKEIIERGWSYFRCPECTFTAETEWEVLYELLRAHRTNLGLSDPQYRWCVRALRYFTAWSHKETAREVPPSASRRNCATNRLFLFGPFHFLLRCVEWKRVAKKVAFKAAVALWCSPGHLKSGSMSNSRGIPRSFVYPHLPGNTF